MAPGNPAIVASSQLLKGEHHAHSSLARRDPDPAHHPHPHLALTHRPAKISHCCRGIFCRAPLTTRTIELEFPMAKKPKLLSDLFYDTLKDVYFAENKILKTLPKMAKAAQSKDLKAAFVKHERETRGHVKRLQGVFKILGKPARVKTCDAIMGITKAVSYTH